MTREQQESRNSNLHHLTFQLRAGASVDKITETPNKSKQHLRGEQRHSLLWKQIQTVFRCCHSLKLCLLNRKKNPSLKDEGGGNLLCTLRSKTPHKGSLMLRSFHFSGVQVLCSWHQVLLLCAQALGSLEKRSLKGFHTFSCVCWRSEPTVFSKLDFKAVVLKWQILFSGCTLEALNHCTLKCPFVAGAALCWCPSWAPAFMILVWQMCADTFCLIGNLHMYDSPVHL